MTHDLVAWHDDMHRRLTRNMALAAVPVDAAIRPRDLLSKAIAAVTGTLSA